MSATAYSWLSDRRLSLDGIDDSLDRIVAGIARRNPRFEAHLVAGGGNAYTRIMVSDGQSQIMIETSPMARGAVHPATTMTASEAVTELFGFVETTVLAFEELYGEEFVGMTRRPVSWEALVQTRCRLHADIGLRLTGDVANFLLSLHDAEPDFALIGLPEAADLPAVRWKLVNLERLKQANPRKHQIQHDALVRLFR